MIMKKKNESLKFKNWTEKEINILKEKAPMYYYKELIKFLPNRSEAAIVKKAKQLNIDLVTYNNKLNNEEIENFIKKNWGKMSKNTMVRKLNVSLCVINRYQKKLKLNNYRTEINLKFVNLNDIKKFNKKNIEYFSGFYKRIIRIRFLILIKILK